MCRSRNDGDVSVSLCAFTQRRSHSRTLCRSQNDVGVSVPLCVFTQRLSDSHSPNASLYHTTVAYCVAVKTIEVCLRLCHCVRLRDGTDTDTDTDTVDTVSQSQ